MAWADPPPLHPGKILVEDFLDPMGISGRQLAAALCVSASRISGLTGGACRINADLALRLGYYFGTSAWFWMNLQVRFDLERAERTGPGPTAGIVPLEHHGG